MGERGISPVPPVEGVLTHYKLVFAAGNGEAEKLVEFDASDASSALIFAHKEAVNRSASLWSSEQKLCTIRRTRVGEGDIWQIGGV